MLETKQDGVRVQRHSYDASGNMALVAGSAIPYPAMTPTVPADGNPPPMNEKNQWTGAGYDLAGNQTSNAWGSYTFDAENRMVTAATGCPAGDMVDTLDRRHG